MKEFKEGNYRFAINQLENSMPESDVTCNFESSTENNFFKGLNHDLRAN